MTTFTTEDRIAAYAEQGTADWLAERLGHVTASRITDVLAKGKTGESETRKKYKWELVAQRMTGISEDGYTNKAMEWGTEKEPDARLEYETRMGLFVDQVGFIKHPSIPYVGASPDGLIDLDGGLEIKCPNSITHLQTIQSGKAPSKYIGQMQMGMWVTDRKWWDFVSYDPRVKKNLQFFTVRVMRDDEYIANMEQEVLLFLKEVDEVIFNLSGENK